MVPKTSRWPFGSAKRYFHLLCMWECILVMKLIDFTSCSSTWEEGLKIFLFEIDGMRGARAHIMEENRKEIIAWRASTRAGEDGEWIRKEQQHGKRREENILFWVSTRREEVGGEKEGETNLQHNKSYKTWKNRTSCFLSNFFSLSLFSLREVYYLRISNLGRWWWCALEKNEI